MLLPNDNKQNLSFCFSHFMNVCTLLKEKQRKAQTRRPSTSCCPKFSINSSQPINSTSKQPTKTKEKKQFECWQLKIEANHRWVLIPRKGFFGKTVCMTLVTKIKILQVSCKNDQNVVWHCQATNPFFFVPRYDCFNRCSTGYSWS